MICNQVSLSIERDIKAKLFLTLMDRTLSGIVNNKYSSETTANQSLDSTFHN